MNTKIAHLCEVGVLNFCICSEMPGCISVCLPPNGLKLSDGGKKSKELGTDATPPFAGARC